MFKNKKIVKILIIGLLLRVFLSIISYHSDLGAFDLAGKVILSGNILNFYDYLPHLPKDNIILTTYPVYLFNYPPAIYFFLGSLTYISYLIVGEGFVNNFLFNLPSTFGTWQLFVHLFLLRLPYLPFDIAGAFIFTKLFKTDKAKTFAFALWIFNPINLYATYLIGQFDIIPAFFILASLYQVLKRGDNPTEKDFILSALFLGLGTAFKIFPVLLIIPLASYAPKWSTRFKIYIFGILPYILTILPFILSKGYRATSLVANQTLKSLYPQIAVSGGESLMLFIVSVGFFYLVIYANRQKISQIWQIYLIILMLFFIFTHFHVQWFVWIMPLLMLEIVISNFRNWITYSIMFASYILMIFLYDPGLSIGLFSPIFPNLLSTPSIWDIIGIKVDYNFARSIAQSVFAFCGVYLIYDYFPKKNTDHIL